MFCPEFIFCVYHRLYNLLCRRPSAPVLSDRGFWIGNQISYLDETLALQLASFLKSEGAKSVLDLGCGAAAKYVSFLRSRGFICDGLDGNPQTQLLSKGIADVADLSMPQNNLQVYDWVLSLEVGEHIPVKFEENFLNNIFCHSRCGVILSWAVPGQGGHGHVNERESHYIIEKFQAAGYRYNQLFSQRLRDAAYLPWFKNTILVFEKISAVKN